MIHSGLFLEEGEVTLNIPVSKGVPMPDCATLRAGNCPDTQEHLTTKVHVRPLDSYSLHDVSFIKIDVEGHQVEVLRGAIKTIAASRPSLHFHLRCLMAAD